MAKRRANGEGNLRKRKDGRWEGRYTAGRDPETGRAIYKNVLGKTQAEAKAKLKQAIEEAKGLDTAKVGRYTVGQWMEVWFEHYAKIKVRPSSHQTYRGYIDNHIKPNIGKVPLEKLTSLELATGLRRGELLGLKWEDIDLERGDLRVRRQIARINGEVVEAPLKTKNAYRTLPLAEDTIDVLKAQRKKAGGSPWVFPSPTGEPISPDSVLNMLHRVLKRAGLPRVRFHDLRHPNVKPKTKFFHKTEWRQLFFYNQPIMPVFAVYTIVKRARIETILNLYALDCIDYLLKFLFDRFFCNDTFCWSALFITCLCNKESDNILLDFV